MIPKATASAAAVESVQSETRFRHWKDYPQLLKHYWDPRMMSRNNEMVSASDRRAFADYKEQRYVMGA
jgi:hypothetical protein